MASLKAFGFKTQAKRFVEDKDKDDLKKQATPVPVSLSPIPSRVNDTTPSSSPSPSLSLSPSHSHSHSLHPPQSSSPSRPQSHKNKAKTQKKQRQGPLDGYFNKCGQRRKADEAIESSDTKKSRPTYDLAEAFQKSLTEPALPVHSPQQQPEDTSPVVHDKDEEQRQEQEEEEEEDLVRETRNVKSLAESMAWYDTIMQEFAPLSSPPTACT